mgnify:CR=1 FL=1
MAKMFDAGSGQKLMAHRQRMQGQITLYMQIMIMATILTMNMLFKLGRKMTDMKSKAGPKENKKDK